jgi:hypothetical protein
MGRIVADELPRRVALRDARVGAATLAAAALVAQQVVGKALRDTLFLHAFGVELLPYAMIGSAIVSGALVVMVSRAAVARSPRRIAQATFLVSAALFTLAWVAATSSPQAAAAITYLHAGGVSAASVSIFWALVSESFDAYSARSSVPRVMAGATLGGVLGGLVTWRAATLVQPSDLLLLGAALNILTLAAVTRLGRVAPRERSEEVSGEDWRALVRELPQLRFMALLVLAGASTQAVLDYLMSSAAVTSLGRGPQLLSFFALFQTTVGVLSFLLQVGVSRSALERFGVGPVLAVSPLLLLGGTAAAAFLPPLAAAVLLRGSDGVLVASLHRSAYEVLFAPVEVTRRRASKPLLDVGFDRLGMLLGSGVVAVIVTAAPARSRGVLLGLVAMLAVARFLLAPRLQAGYRGTLADNLRREREGSSAIFSRQPAGSLSLAGFDLPSGPELDVLAQPPQSDVLALLAELRSGDPQRASAVLRVLHTEPLLAPQVIALLGDDRVARDAADWLTAQDPPPAGLLGDALMDPRQSDAARRRTARILGKLDDPRAAHGLVAALPRVPTGVRRAVASALARVSEKVPLPSEPLLTAARRAAAEPPRGDERGELEEIFSLIAAAYPGEPVVRALRALERNGEARGTALEWLDVILPQEVKSALWPRIVRGDERIAATSRGAAELRKAVGATPLQADRVPDGDTDEDA